MTAVIFTHPPDYPKAAIAAASLRRLGVDTTWAIDANDPTDGIPPEIPVIRSSVPRNGNLRGPQWTAEQLAIMASVGSGHDWVIKIDSDTVVGRLCWLKSALPHHDLAGMFLLHPGMTVPRLYGGLYAIRPESITAARLDSIASLPVNSDDNEDRIVGMLFPSARNHAFRHDRQSGMMAGFDRDSPWTAADWFDRYNAVSVNPNRRMEKHQRLTESAQTMRYLLDHLLTVPPVQSCI